MKDKLITNKKFSILLGFTALTIALCAAFFSVYGIGSLFAGAAISAMIMAGSLELGKLVATTFLYRYWTKTVGLVKTYLTIAVIALMIITSAGIFGFLSAAYQKSSLTYKLNQERIANIEQSKGYYTNVVSISQERIRILNETRKVQEARLSEALTNTFLVRNSIQLQQIQQQTIKLIDQANEDIKTENTKIDGARDKMQLIDENVNNLKIGATEKKDIQTFKFLADALKTDLDTVAKWFIISLIFVFDPLAIALILAYNVVVYRKEDESVYEKNVESKLELSKELINSKKSEIQSLVDVTKEKKVEPVNIPVEPPIIEETNHMNKNDKTQEIENKLNEITQSQSKETVEPKRHDSVEPSEMNEYYKRMFKQ